MIGQLRGTLLEKRPPVLLLDVSGVGYEVEAPMTVFYDLPDAGAELTLHTHFVVREDAQLLYGFADRYERELFRALIKVNGVGPKMALAILSGIEADRLARCIQDQDTTSLVKVNARLSIPGGKPKQVVLRLLLLQGLLLQNLHLQHFHYQEFNRFLLTLREKFWKEMVLKVIFVLNSPGREC